jgi:hypothetical protein
MIASPAFTTGDLIALGMLTLAVGGFALREIRAWLNGSTSRTAADTKRDGDITALRTSVENLVKVQADASREAQEREAEYREFRGAILEGNKSRDAVAASQGRAIERISAMISRLFAGDTAAELVPGPPRRRARL